MPGSELEEQFGEALDPEEMDELARSVAEQWQRYGGYTCLFLDGDQRLEFQFHEHGDGTYEVVPRRMSADLGRSLSSLGFPPEAFPELIARINLGQEIDFRDGQGVPAVLWHDPKAGRIRVRQVGPARPAVPGETPPAVCPTCTAVMRPWREGERQQNCSHCGHTVSLSSRLAVPVEAPSVLCPTCTAVLRPWPTGERQQTCSHCRRIVSLG